MHETRAARYARHGRSEARAGIRDTRRDRAAGPMLPCCLIFWLAYVRHVLQIHEAFLFVCLRAWAAVLLAFSVDPWDQLTLYLIRKCTHLKHLAPLLLQLSAILLLLLLFFPYIIYGLIDAAVLKGLHHATIEL